MLSHASYYKPYGKGEYTHKFAEGQVSSPSRNIVQKEKEKND